MLRKIKILLYSLISIIIIAIFFELISSLDNSSVPNNKAVIDVYSSKVVKNWDKKNTIKWNKKYNKKNFFKILKHFSKDNHISLVKLRTDNFNGHKTKIVYDLGTKTNNFSLYQNKSVKKLSNKDLELEEIYGLYCTNANPKVLKQLVSQLCTFGMKVHTIDNPLSIKFFLLSILADLSTTNLLITANIIGILFIVMILEKVYRFKAYAVMKINGLSTNQIIITDLKDEAFSLVLAFSLIIGGILIWSFCTLTLSSFSFFIPRLCGILVILFLVFFILNFLSYVVLALIDPAEAIKGAQHTRPFLLIGYILKAVLLILIIFNTISLYNSNKTYTNDVKIIKKWHMKKNTYSPMLVWHIEDHQEDRKVSRIVHQLVVQSPGVILARNSQQFQPTVRSTKPENGNVIIANNNFIKQSEFHLQLHKANAKQILLLVPRNRMDQVNQAEKDLRDFEKWQNTLPNYYHKNYSPKIQVIPIASNQQIFNYTIGQQISSSISTNPLIVVVNDKLLSDDFYSASVTQGTVQFSNLGQLKSLIQHLGLTPYIIGISSKQARLDDYNRKANNELIMLTIMTVLSLFQLSFIILFVSSTFLQSQRRKMAIFRVFGKSNTKLVGLFLFINLGCDLLIVTCILAKLKHLTLMPIVLTYLLLEGLIILLMWHWAEKNLLITLNHGN
ncbi:hypothetical protein [Lactobacillus bombicola]|uniref:DUF1430 domain-containing protein n=1 Tax=Lactobacillus bombicola TaxID=1505723 RepID=A0A396STT4_9LACO|nr:hypothetical protein [Lactobacillus bombicola]RHW55322.1 hypothetical protein DS835_00200 [Lactobacillus bombicola]